MSRAGLPAVVDLECAQPETVRSATAFIPGSADMYTGPTMAMHLDASGNARDWRKTTDVVPGLVPSAVSFAPVKARYFRLDVTPLETLAPQDKDAVPPSLP